MTPPPAPQNLARLGGVLAPALWGLLTCAVFFHYAQFIDKVGWNAIELIIAQKLTEHGVYATSLDYASAVAWRPVLPTLVVTFFHLWTEDPIRIYQLACGLSFGTLVVTMFLSGRLLGNAWTGHLAALGAFFRKNGLYTIVRWNGFFTNPPLIITSEELDFAFDVIDRGLTEVEKALGLA